MKADIEKYIQGCDICMSLKAQRHKLYSSLQSLPVLTHKWKDLSIDFVTGLFKSKDWRRVKYDLIMSLLTDLQKW